MSELAKPVWRCFAAAAVLMLAACGGPVTPGQATTVGTGGLTHPDIAVVPGTPNDLISPNN